MTAHLCPLTLGQILALAAIARVAGHERLAGESLIAWAARMADGGRP